MWLTDPVRREAVVLSSGVSTLQVTILLLRFSQLLLQRAGAADTEDRH